jgi:hypothetical protein
MVSNPSPGAVNGLAEALLRVRAKKGQRRERDEED